jgi:c(7)-type cytochrome triheme protein
MPSMRKLTLLVLLLSFICVFALIAQDKKAPPKMTFTSKMGNVTFDHDAHSKREKNNCKACHDTLWKQEKGDLKFKQGMHKPAEAAKTSCGACHHAGGKSFAATAKENCSKCHVKGKA